MQLTLDLAKDTHEKLTALSDLLGYSPEMAAEYAIRLVAACVREGLIADVSPGAWPQEARALTGTHGKVIDLEPLRAKRTKSTR